MLRRRSVTRSRPWTPTPSPREVVSVTPRRTRPTRCRLFARLPSASRATSCAWRKAKRTCTPPSTWLPPRSPASCASTRPACMDKKVRATERIVDYAHEDAHPESELDLDRLMDELSEDEIVRRKETEFTPMTEEEALVQIDLLGHDFFAYTDRDTNLVQHPVPPRGRRLRPAHPKGGLVHGHYRHHRRRSRRATSTSTPPPSPPRRPSSPSVSTRWTWSSSSATWRRPARSTSASPRGLSPWAISSLTSTRCKPPAAQYQPDEGPAAVRLRGLFRCLVPCVCCRKRPRLGSCRFAGGNVSEPRSIRAVALHFHKNRFRSAFPVMVASRFVSSRSVGEGPWRCMKSTSCERLKGSSFVSSNLTILATNPR